MSAPPSKPSQSSPTTFNERLNEQLINCLNVQTNVIQNLSQYSQHISLQLFEIKVSSLFSFIFIKVIFLYLEHRRNTFKSSISSSTAATATSTISFRTKSLSGVLLSKLYASSTNTGFSSSSASSTLCSSTICSNTYANYDYNSTKFKSSILFSDYRKSTTIIAIKCTIISIFYIGKSTTTIATNNYDKYITTNDNNTNQIDLFKWT